MRRRPYILGQWSFDFKKGSLRMSNTTISRRANLGLWAVQILLAAAFGMAGFMKLTQPIEALTQMMVWPGEMPALARFIGAAELAGALGMILPMATGILPRLTALAAAGFALIQILAMAFHVSRDEFGVLPVNALLLGLALLVCFGRRSA